MKALTNDTRMVSGLGFALASAGTFALSGPFARGLIDAGWTAGAAVTVRMGIAALALLVPTLLALRGRWSVLRDPRVLRTIAGYGALGVVLPQLCFFYAVSSLQVGVALLIEYTAPVAVIGYMWLRYAQRPGALTLAGAASAAAGLVLVLDLLGGIRLDPVGVAWALGSVVGAAAYFIMSGNTDTDLPGVALAGGGLIVGFTLLAAASATGILPFTVTTTAVQFAGRPMPVWLAALLLGLIATGSAYVLGIAAARRLGARLASFVALIEVVAAIVYAWVLLGELPTWTQLAGGVLILAGVIGVKLGERDIAAPLGATPETVALGSIEDARPGDRPVRDADRPADAGAGELGGGVDGGRLVGAQEDAGRA